MLVQKKRYARIYNVIQYITKERSLLSKQLLDKVGR